MATITSRRMTITITITAITGASVPSKGPTLGVPSVGGLGVLTLVPGEVELRINELK